jgi:hypothetical protein
LQVEANFVSCHTADFKPVKQEVNGTVILPPLVFPGVSFLEVEERYADRKNGREIKGWEEIDEKERD